MNPFNRQRGDDLHAEIHRADRRMFAARPLPVTVAADDNPGFSGIADRRSPFGESRPARLVEALEDDLRIDRNIAAVLQMNAGRHDVVGRDFVADLDDHDAVELVRQRLVDRRRADGALADDLAGTARQLNHIVVDLEHFGFNHVRVFDSGGAGVGELAGERDGDGGFGADQVSLIALRAVRRRNSG